MRKKYEIAFQYDLYGNQITHSSKEGTKIIRYNEKNQIEQIESKQGITYLRYDENGNLSQKINADGREDNYTYDEWDQMIELSQGQEIYAYAYDGQGGRIRQTYEDQRDYQMEVWYYREEQESMIEERELKETIQAFKEKVRK